MKPGSSKKRAYLDFASATPMSPAATRAYTNSLSLFGNASAPHAEGRAAKDALSLARQTIARALTVKAEELVFTSGGTESNNLAIIGVLRALHAAGRAYASMHCITTTIEHSSVTAPFRMLEDEGVRVTYIDPEPNGIVSAKKILSAVTKDTVLISLAHVNSEIGTIQPVAEIGAALRKHTVRPYLHVDAAQSPLYLDAGPHTLRADLVTYDAQKVMGPKGVGVLYRDFSVSITAVSGGGSQERSVRPGTENVPAIVATSVAFAEASKGRKARAVKVTKLRDYLIKRIEKEIPEASITGSIKRRIANNVHVTIPRADGDYLSVLMDKEGIAVSPRSACVGSGGEVSSVVLALTKDHDRARGTLRMTLGPTTTKGELDRAIKALKKALPIALK